MYTLFTKTKNLITTLTILLSLVVYGSHIFAQTCQADFVPNGTGAYGVYFLNHSTGTFATASWDFGDGVSTGNNLTDSIFHTYTNAGTYQVCLTITNGTSSCQSTYCTDITLDADGDLVDSTCHFTDCVFPGDANHDQVVNVEDVLPIAIHFGATGPTRLNATTDFVGQAAPDWASSMASGVNFKHLDCNGDGLVGFQDLPVVQQNYSFEHDGLEQKNTDDGLPFYVTFDPVNYPASGDPFIVTAGIYIGTTNDPVINIYGLTFLLQYDPSLIEPNSASLAFDHTSIIAANNTPLALAIDDYNSGLVAAAYARTDQNNVSGASRIATASFTISDLVIGRQSQIQFSLDAIGGVGVDSLGNQLGIGKDGDKITISTTGTSQRIQTPENILLYPNPVTDRITLDLGRLNGEYIEIYNVYGQKLQEFSFNRNGGISTFNISQLQTGIYTITVHTEEGTASQRFFVK